VEKIPAVKYMRDFYPDDMRLRLWIEDHWRQASLRAGFQEWDAPIMEYLDLYARKSGDEIVSQLFSIAPREGADSADAKRMAIRPEMTPSLARMIAARQAALPKPIKWFCIARMCRSERGQRGRLREFWQWNADVLGSDDPTADAEVIAVAVDALSSMGLTSEEVEVRINSRAMFSTLLTDFGVKVDQEGAVYAALDKRAKVTDEAFRELLLKSGVDDAVADRIDEAMNATSIEEYYSRSKTFHSQGFLTRYEELHRVFKALDALGVAEWCRFDPGVVRGLAYYTGPVFEIFDRKANLRALAGGGRYDNLLSVVGGQPMPAVGFGMGDVVLGELLKELNKLPNTAMELDDFVILLEDERLPDVLSLVGLLRRAGRRTDFASSAGNLGKLMKRADQLGARRVILVGGDEWKAGDLKIKDMKSRTEVQTPMADFRTGLQPAPT
jgi:histidyl-tRNA synthetase